MGFGDLPAILVLEWWRQATPRARSLARPACVREFSVQLKWFNKRFISMNGREWLRKTPGTKLWFPHTCISSTPTHIHAHVYTHMHAHHIYIHMQKISGESRHPCFILILEEMLYFPLATIMVFPTCYNYGVRFVIHSFCHAEVFSFFSHFLQGFTTKGYWTFSKSLFFSFSD